MDSEEGQRYMTFYKIKQWPYVAVLDPRTGELMVEWNYSDCPTYEVLINEFLATSSWGDEKVVVPDTSPKAKKRRTETILDASEDDQLMAAIRASLAESSDKNNDEASGGEDGDEEEDDDVEPWTDSESDSRASLAHTAPSLPEEATTISTELPSDDNASAANDCDWERHLGAETDPVSLIIFRFPDGSKEQKSLPATSTLMVKQKRERKRKEVPNANEGAC